MNVGDDRRRSILAPATAFLILSILATVLRLVARRIQKIRYNASDYTILIALACAICKGIIVVACLSIFDISQTLLTNTKVPILGSDDTYNQSAHQILRFFLRRVQPSAILRA